MTDAIPIPNPPSPAPKIDHIFCSNLLSHRFYGYLCVLGYNLHQKGAKRKAQGGVRSRTCNVIGDRSYDPLISPGTGGNFLTRTDGRTVFTDLRSR